MSVTGHFLNSSLILSSLIDGAVVLLILIVVLVWRIEGSERFCWYSSSLRRSSPSMVRRRSESSMRISKREDSEIGMVLIFVLFKKNSVLLVFWFVWLVLIWILL